MPDKRKKVCFLFNIESSLYLSCLNIEDINRNPDYLTKLVEQRTAKLLAEEEAEREQVRQEMLWENYDRKCMELWNEKRKLMAKALEAKEQARLSIQKVSCLPSVVS